MFSQVNLRLHDLNIQQRQFPRFVEARALQMEWTLSPGEVLFVSMHLILSPQTHPLTQCVCVCISLSLSLFRSPNLSFCACYV